MNRPRNNQQPLLWITLRMPILLSAGLLLAATWLPVVEIKGFDTFDFSTVALWAGRISRFTLGAAILALALPSLYAARWFLVLSVGILLSPLVDMVVRSLSLAEMMDVGIGGDFKSLIVPLNGSWVAAAGLVLWIADSIWFAVRASLPRK
jgi:hypothetical protein